jgi:nucleoside-diphosphate-sugar epimerase
LKILLAGCGDIAQRTALQLGPDHSCYGLRRNPQNLPNTIVPLVGNITDVPGISAVLSQQFDVMLVTLTPDRFTEQAYRESYLKGAEAIAEAIEQGAVAPKLVLWVSSTSVYGDNNGDWVDEASATNPQSFSGMVLLEAELVIRSLPCASSIVRFSGIYGPGRTRMLDQIRAGKGRPAEPKQWSNRIHSDDCGGVLAHLINCFAAGETLQSIYLGTDSAPVTQHDLRKWLAGEMQVQLRDEVVAQNAVRRCSNQRLLGAGYQFTYPSYREGYLALMDQKISKDLDN